MIKVQLRASALTFYSLLSVYSCCCDSVCNRQRLWSGSNSSRPDNQKIRVWAGSSFMASSESKDSYWKNQGRLYSRDRYDNTFLVCNVITWSYRKLIQFIYGRSDRHVHGTGNFTGLPDYNAYCTCFHCSFQPVSPVFQVTTLPIIWLTHP